jgi:hypothetical protein
LPCFNRRSTSFVLILLAGALGSTTTAAAASTEATVVASVSTATTAAATATTSTATTIATTVAVIAGCRAGTAGESGTLGGGHVLGLELAIGLINDVELDLLPNLESAEATLHNGDDRVVAEDLLLVTLTLSIDRDEAETSHPLDAGAGRTSHV